MADPLSQLEGGLPGIVLAAAWLVFALGVRANAAPPDRERLPMGAQIGSYVGEDVMIPMRDGIKLHAEVWRPQGLHGPLPILLQRSPYGFGVAAVTRSFDAEYKELAQEGFILVLEDIRGRFGSEGDFVMLRPKAAAGGVDESTDAYDTIDWLVRSLPDNNGNVGVFGVSYLGWTTAMSVINPHPALKAVSVQASPEDMFLGDDFHHNGAFRLDYGWEYAAALEADGRTLNAFDFKNDDPYSWFLKQDDLATLDKQALGRTLPEWQEFVEHPAYDQFWRSGVTSTEMPGTVAIPDLIVAGWWDQEDFYGPLKIYQGQKRGDPRRLNFLVIGPWNHGGWSKAEWRSYGAFDLGSDTAAYFRAKVETPWFKYWLKNEGVLNQPKALVFETGSNEWRGYEEWPPKEGVSRRKLFFHSNGKLSFDPPHSPMDAAADHFVSDPENPVPYRERPIPSVVAENSTWESWLADDQRSFEKRADVLSWRSEPLQVDVTIRGDVIAQLFTSTTGTDADWVVKLIDVYPHDEVTPPALRSRELIIADEVFRGRFRSSFERPRPLVPNKVQSYSIDLHSASHVFKQGHRIAVQVQSSWFPLIDQNPQIYRPNIFKTHRSQFRSQTHSVFHTTQYPSGILVDVAAPPR